ncbi:MAG TPA: TraR/DksA C4-type zinc finger protein [Acidimicrobiales bacterium]|nr:TraR/DksA C4-type zinc finger protein [Acidimicrobiales bacterium]
MTIPGALQAELAAARRLVEDLRVELAGILVEQKANPPDDEHDVEGSSVGYERARVTALLAEAERRLHDLEAVGERLADGTYGSCQVCGGPIGEERLAALPASTRCISCAAATPGGLPA